MVNVILTNNVTQTLQSISHSRFWELLDVTLPQPCRPVWDTFLKCEEEIFLSNCLSFSLSLLRKLFIDIDKWSARPQKTPFQVKSYHQNHAALKKGRAGEPSEEGSGETKPHGLQHGLCCPVHPAAHSIVDLMKSRAQSLSIWPACHGPVKDNRLAQQSHYITICRCRQAQQRRDTVP